MQLWSEIVTFAAAAINRQRFREALRSADSPQQPFTRPIRVFAVDVNVGSGDVFSHGIRIILQHGPSFLTLLDRGFLIVRRSFGPESGSDCSGELRPPAASTRTYDVAVNYVALRPSITCQYEDEVNLQ
jgi:hypothetical protein